MTIDRSQISLFGLSIDAMTLSDAANQVASWADAPWEKCRYVVTPNVDHVVMLQHDSQFARAYRGADLVLADGWPVVWASRILRRPLPGLAPGSDLTPRIFDQWSGSRPLRVYLLGAMPGVGKRAANRIHEHWSNVEVVGVYSPPLGFEYDEIEGAKIIEQINAVTPDVLVLGVGAPKQELWIHRHRRQLRAKTVLCVGATIDFLAGEKKRAPLWMRRFGLEWLHRMLSEPKRLGKRYLRDAVEFPLLLLGELFASNRIGGRAKPAT